MLRTLLNGRKEKEQSKKGQGKETLNDPALDDADRKCNLLNISEGHVEINASRKDNCQLKYLTSIDYSIHYKLRVLSTVAV